MIKDKKVKYYLAANGEFVIENYAYSKPFANFFPGIAGKYGIPMWVFYVNRGQAIVSLGTKDKDHSILEFLSANKSWQMVSTHRFRTFIKLHSAKKNVFYEPFHNGFQNLGFNLNNKMSCSSSGLTLEEKNLTLGLNVRVEYFNIPNDSYAGLVRTVTIKNLSRASKRLELLDGLPQIVPYGTSNLFLKKLSRTIEAWMGVENLEKGIPFYKLDVDPTDRPEVVHIKEGNFYLAFHYENNRPKIIKPIVDPESIFGYITDFSMPSQFMAKDNFKYPKKQITTSKTPCAFSLLDIELAAQEEKTFYAVIGYARDLKSLNSCAPRITSLGYLAQKKEENKRILEELQQDIFTKSSSPRFDLYAKQTYLDNIMRGGYPIVFKTNFSESVYYLYSRKHGDLERDYNKFQLQDTYFSQGNGNYRDINQNRRSDIWFNPDVLDENLVCFFNLLQTDGFNPLIVKGANFLIKKSFDLKTVLGALAEEKQIPEIISRLDKPFTPGDIILYLEEHKIKLKVSCDDFLNVLLAHSTKTQEAEHGEGFWTDHWTYNLDLLESYLGVYPEKAKEIIFQKKCFVYYDNAEIVKPRCQKYQLYHGLVRQLQSVTEDKEKKELIDNRTNLPHLVRSQYGKGEIYHTTLINKLLCLIVNKLSSLDPFGIGIEMEANKPNWYDSLNGLPALFGSSLCETLELKKLLLLVKNALQETEIAKISITEEIYDFLIQLNILLEDNFRNSSCEKDLLYWDKSYSLKEDYRLKTKLGLSGKEIEAEKSLLLSILDFALQKVGLGIEKAKDRKNNIYYSYFINEVKEYEVANGIFIKPVKFIQKKLPFFLEGQVHALKLAKNANEAMKLHTATRLSELYDKGLKMYKVTAPLKSQPEEIGRCRVFTPGWLENESIWLHMEYKFLLETLKQGLCEEFYSDFKNVLIAFQNPRRYGRSILENSSFLVSSAFPDKDLHGNGFVARLSGSTAEFLQIWLTMNIGISCFLLDNNNDLNLRLRPMLAGWLFDRKGNYSFTFLGKISVVYHNPKRKNTFGKNGAKITRIDFYDRDNKPVETPSDTIGPPYAEQIRSRLIKTIDVYFD